MVERPPRGYTQLQYPLPHNFTYRFSLGAENGNRESTIATLIRSSEVATGVDAVEVNPRNAAFAEDTGPLIHMGSIVPRMTLSMRMTLSKAAIETDAVRKLKVNWMPLYISFENSLTAKDDKTAVEIEDILELQHDTTNKDTYPLFATTKLTGMGGAQPLSTVPAAEALADYGLTTTSVLEQVAFDKELFWDASQYYTNAAMLRKVTGRMHSVTLYRDREYKYFSRNFTYPSVKRGNPYTFCGILFHLPQAGTAEQNLIVTETTDIDHVHISLACRFNEWNPEFDQSAL